MGENFKISFENINTGESTYDDDIFGVADFSDISNEIDTYRPDTGGVVERLADYYGTQQFQYGSYIGAIGDAISGGCPAIAAALEQGFDAVVDVVSGHEVSDEEAEVLKNIQPEKEQIEESEKSEEKSPEATLVANKSEPLELQKEQTETPVPRDEIAPRPEVSGSRIERGPNSSMEATVADAESKTTQGNSTEAPKLPTELSVEYAINQIPTIQDEVAAKVNKATEIASTTETKTINLAVLKIDNTIRVDVVDVTPLRNDSKERVNDIEESLELPGEMLQGRISDIRVDRENDSNVRYASRISELEASDEKESAGDYWPEQPPIETGDAKVVEPAEAKNENSLFEVSHLNNQKSDRESTATFLIGEVLELEQVNVEIENTENIRLELVDAVIELVREYPDTTREYGSEIAQQQASVVSANIRVLEHVSSAEECYDALSAVQEELVKLLLLLGYENAAAIAERLMAQYNIQTLKQYMTVIAQSRTSHRKIGVRTRHHVAIHPCYHKCGIGVVKMVVELVTSNRVLRDA